MKNISLNLLFLLALNQVQAQFNINKENIITPEISNINQSIVKVYLKKGRDKIILKNDSIIFQKDYYNFNTKETYTFEKRLKNEGGSIPLNQLQDLAKGQQVIDKAPIYIETYFLDDTKGKQMIYSNQMIEDFFRKLNVKYRAEIDDYINQLPSGKYTYSMFINRRIKENKSTFYNAVEKDLIVKGMINEDIFNQPLIYINHVKSTFDELNQLDMNKIESYKILSYADASIYGSSAKNGLILITLVD